MFQFSQKRASKIDFFQAFRSVGSRDSSEMALTFSQSIHTMWFYSSLSLWIKSKSVSIQMEATDQYFPVVTIDFQYFAK